MLSNSSTFDLQSKTPPPFCQYTQNELWAPVQGWANLKFRSGPNKSTEINWQANGLITPAEVAEATQDYREDQDVIGQFLDECVHETMISALPCQKLYRIYVWWAKKRGEFVHSDRRFQAAMTERGIKRARKESYRTYLDIAVHPEIEDEYLKDCHEA
jgi:phage/plasmid-associated DNA primase